MRLGPEGRDRLQRDLAADLRLLEGTVVEVGSGRLVLNVPWAVRERGFHRERLEQQIDLAEQEYLEVEQKELNTLRTGGVLAAGGAAVAVAVARMLAGDAGGGTQQPPGTPSETLILRIPLFFR